MNTARLQVIVDRIKANPTCWDQEHYHHPCKTAHCIAGHAQNDAKVSNMVTRDLDWILEVACEWLELTIAESRYLFASWRTLLEIEKFLNTQKDTK